MLSMFTNLQRKNTNFLNLFYQTKTMDIIIIIGG